QRAAHNGARTESAHARGRHSQDDRAGGRPVRPGRPRPAAPRLLRRPGAVRPGHRHRHRHFQRTRAGQPGHPWRVGQWRPGLGRPPAGRCPARPRTGAGTRMNISHPGYLGVLGGMGPLAGAAFAMRVAALTPAATDQQHVPTLLRNDPRIPDRSDARMRGGEDPLPYMREGLRFLETAGARVIAIPCNTAHLWYDELAAATALPILHIIDAVIDDLRRMGIARGRIGLMGTPATLAL